MSKQNVMCLIKHSTMNSYGSVGAYVDYFSLGGKGGGV